MSWIFFTLLNVFGNGTATFILKKQTNNPRLGYVGVMLISLLFSALTLFPFFLWRFFASPILFSNSLGFFYFLGSLFFNILAFYFFIKALSLNELSFFGPLETLRPFFVVVLSLIFLAEQPTLFLIVGISSIVIGAVVLQLQKNLSTFIKKLFHSSAPFFVVASTFCFAITSLFDRQALHFIDPMKYSFLLTGGLVLGFIFIQKISKKRIERKYFYHSTFILTGILLAIGSLGIGFALKAASPNVVVPVQMTRSLYLSFLGFTVLGEKDYRRKIVAAFLMLLGVFFITR